MNTQMSRQYKQIGCYKRCPQLHIRKSHCLMKIQCKPVYKMVPKIASVFYIDEWFRVTNKSPSTTRAEVIHARPHLNLTQAD